MITKKYISQKMLFYIIILLKSFALVKNVPKFSLIHAKNKGKTKAKIKERLNILHWEYYRMYGNIM